jgi:methyl-accepting chemotaxis protein
MIESLVTVVSAAAAFVIVVASFSPAFGNIGKTLGLLKDIHHTEENGSKGETGEILDRVSSLINRYNALSTATYNSGDELASVTAAISSAIAEQTGGIDEQSKAITETTATVREVSQTSQQAAEKAQTIVGLSDRAVEVYQEGVEAFNNSTAEINRLDEQVELSAESIVQLATFTQQIGVIVNEVRNLAERSNILALNASIEAARSGESGRGFGVVASEVKQLADKSKRAAAKIQDIISEIQGATNTSVMVAEEASKRVVSATAMIAVLREKIAELAEHLETARQAAKMISSSANQQSIGMEQITVAMTNITEVTDEYIAGNRRTEEAARRLNIIGGDLCELAEQYKPED